MNPSSSSKSSSSLYWTPINPWLNSYRTWSNLSKRLSCSSSSARSISTASTPKSSSRTRPSKLSIHKSCKWAPKNSSWPIKLRDCKQWRSKKCCFRNKSKSVTKFTTKGKTLSGKISNSTRKPSLTLLRKTSTCLKKPPNFKSSSTGLQTGRGTSLLRAHTLRPTSGRWTTWRKTKSKKTTHSARKYRAWRGRIKGYEKNCTLKRNCPWLHTNSRIRFCRMFLSIVTRAKFYNR